MNQKSNFWSKHKVLLFAHKIDNDVVHKQGETSNPVETGFYFVTKEGKKSPMKIKAHFTSYAISNATQRIAKKYGAAVTSEVLKQFFLTLQELTNSNTAIFSLYIPKLYLSKQVLSSIEEEENLKNN